MKKLLFTFACTFITLVTVLAQDCQNFYFMTNNSQIEMTTYDKKGGKSGVMTWKITDVKKDGNSFIAQVNSTFSDEKGKEITKSTGSYKCTNGLLEADVRMSLPQQQGQPMQPTEAQMSSAYIEYPSNMSVGQSLKDVDFNMDMNMSGGMKANMNFKETNRKVDAKEKVTTPAGTWDAYVISYESFMKTKMGAIGMPGFTFQVKEWFVPGFGLVKSETYSKNGKLAGSMQLTSIKK